MDVVINKRKIRDTVKQMVDNGRKNLKQEIRNHPASTVFQGPFRLESQDGSLTVCCAKAILTFYLSLEFFSFCRKSCFRLFYWRFPDNLLMANSVIRNVRPVHKGSFLLLRYIVFFNDSLDFD